MENPVRGCVSSLIESLSGLVSRFNRPVYALPLDLFRILVGLLSSAYFLQCFFQVDDFSAPNGLIDHALSWKMFWWTRIGLFHTALDGVVFKGLFLLASLSSLALAAGWRVNLNTWLLYLISVSTYRWNFLAMYVDDAILHLLLFWMLLLPVGNTLVLLDWLHEGKSAWLRWRRKQVSGAVLRCFLANLVMIYAIAGLWKWTSPMWRGGNALFAVLNLPISYLQGSIWAEASWVLTLANYVAMVLEPALPLMLFLSAGHPLKWLLLFLALGFHFGILLSLKIPYANLACISAMVLIFRDEIMARVVRVTNLPSRNLFPAAEWRSVASMLVLVCLVAGAAAEVRMAPWRAAEPLAGILGPREGAGSDGPPETRFALPYAILWAIGIAQGYRLFDWIDERNFMIDYQVRERKGGHIRNVDPEELFPSSSRGVALQCYLHGIPWASVPRDRSSELRRSLLERFASRYCRDHPGSGEITAYGAARRVYRAADRKRADDLDLLLQFRCLGTETDLLFLREGG